MTTKKNSPAIEEELEEQVAPDAVENADIAALSPDPEFYELASGKVVRIVRLKTRETLKLLKIVTHGAGASLTSIDWSAVSGDASAFAGQLIAVLTMAVPNAEEETLDFIQSMVEPVELNQRPRSKADRDSNQELWDDIALDLINPEIEDTIGILTNIVRQEAGDIQALGKRLRVMIPMALNS